MGDIGPVRRIVEAEPLEAPASPPPLREPAPDTTPAPVREPAEPVKEPVPA